MTFESQVINCPQHLGERKFHDCIHSRTESFHSQVKRIESEKVESLEPRYLENTKYRWNGNIPVEKIRRINRKDYNILEKKLSKELSKYQLCVFPILAFL